jgi:hypothetical protein
MSDEDSDYVYLSEEEFLELRPEEKWSYLKSLMVQTKQYKIMSDKNCAECIHFLQTVHDVNIDLFFDDWRACAEHCDECNKLNQVEMCNTQFELISHLANEIADLSDKVNRLIKYNFVKSVKGKELYEEMTQEVEFRKRGKENADGLFS